jgi:hypothetical protein
MTSSRVLIALLVAATVLVDWVVVCLDGPPRKVIAALFYSQVNLLAVWVGLARPVSPWRWTCLVGFIVLFSLFVGTAVDVDRAVTTKATFVLLTQVVFVAGSLWITGLLGVILVKDAGDGTDQDDAEIRKPLQFSLGQMFGWMIGLAVCLGLLRCAIDYAHLLALLRSVPVLGLFLLFTGNVVIVFFVLWIALSSRWLAVRGAVLCVMIIVAIVHFTTLDPPTGAGIFPAMLTLYVLLMVGSLWVVRMAGYRLTVRKKTSARSGAELGNERDTTEAPDGDASLAV